MPHTFRRSLVLAALVATPALFALPAHARDVQWSVGISAPIGYGGAVNTVVSSGPVYVPAPVYYTSAPVMVVPAPRVIVAPPVYLSPVPVVYEPGPVWVPAYGGRWHHHHHHHHHDYD